MARGEGDVLRPRHCLAHCDERNAGRVTVEPAADLASARPTRGASPGPAPAPSAGHAAMRRRDSLAGPGRHAEAACAWTCPGSGFA